MGELVCQAAVVGEDNQASGVDIQASDGEDSTGRGDQVNSLFSSAGVGIGADDVFGFVQKEIDFPVEADVFTVYGDPVFFRIDEGGQLLYESAVDADAAVADELFAFSA